MDDRKWQLSTKGAKMSNVERGVWTAWCNGMIECAAPEEERVQLDPLEEIKPKVEERPVEDLELLDCTVQCAFIGEVTPKSLMRALARITVPEGRCRVTFHIERLPDGQ